MCCPLPTFESLPVCVAPTVDWRNVRIFLFPMSLSLRVTALTTELNPRSSSIPCTRIKSSRHSPFSGFCKFSRLTTVSLSLCVATHISYSAFSFLIVIQSAVYHQPTPLHILSSPSFNTLHGISAVCLVPFAHRAPFKLKITMYLL